MENIDATHLLHPFSLRIWVKARPEDVQLGWTKSALVARWMAGEAVFRDASGYEVPDAVSGGRLEWDWVDGSREVSSVREVSAGLFRFGWFEDMGEVTVRFSADGEGTLVELRQTMGDKVEPQVRLGAQVGSRTAWTFYLSNLKSVVEGGLDLRERDMGRRGVLNS